MGILWNTPKKRRSLEVRKRKSFGMLEWGSYKKLRPNRRLRVDHQTGHYFELGKLEVKSFLEIMEETKAIQAKMREAFGLGPKDKEVAVAYADETDKFGNIDGVKVVEMEKERPSFFSKQLMQKSTKAKPTDDTTTTVRPSGLG